jgi:hypothetical protein
MKLSDLKLRGQVQAWRDGHRERDEQHTTATLRAAWGQQGSPARKQWPTGHYTSGRDAKEPVPTM